MSEIYSTHYKLGTVSLNGVQLLTQLDMEKENGWEFVTFTDKPFPDIDAGVMKQSALFKRISTPFMEKKKHG